MGSQKADFDEEAKVTGASDRHGTALRGLIQDYMDERDLDADGERGVPS